MDAPEVVGALGAAVGVRVPAAEGGGIGGVEEADFLLAALDGHARLDHEVEGEEELAVGEGGGPHLAAGLVGDAPGVALGADRARAALVDAVAVEVGVAELVEREVAGLGERVAQLLEVGEVRGRGVAAPDGLARAGDAGEEGPRVEAVFLREGDVAVEAAGVHRVDGGEAHRVPAVVLGEVAQGLLVARAGAVEAEVEALVRVVARLRRGQREGEDAEAHVERADLGALRVGERDRAAVDARRLAGGDAHGGEDLLELALVEGEGPERVGVADEALVALVVEGVVRDLEARAHPGVAAVAVLVLVAEVVVLRRVVGADEVLVVEEELGDEGAPGGVGEVAVPGAAALVPELDDAEVDGRGGNRTGLAGEVGDTRRDAVAVRERVDDEGGRLDLALRGDPGEGREERAVGGVGVGQSLDGGEGGHGVERGGGALAAGGGEVRRHAGGVGLRLRGVEAVALAEGRRPVGGGGRAQGRQREAGGG